jgi:Uma2 family endonuclease
MTTAAIPSPTAAAWVPTPAPSESPASAPAREPPAPPGRPLPAAGPDPSPWRLTREEYYTLGEAGYFKGRRTELIDGEVLFKMTQNEPHATALILAFEALRTLFGVGHHVRQQLPLNLGTFHDPEPDLAVVRGGPRDHRRGPGPWDHPNAALLIVEISDSTLWFDRARKSHLYASAAVPEYWIVNLIERRVEVHRNPTADATAYLGFRYASVTTVSDDGSIAPVAKPETAVKVADLLP